MMRHVLMDSVPDGVITIAQGDREAADADGADGVRRRRTARDDPAKSGGYFTAQSLLGMEPLPLMVPKDPPRQSMDRFLMTSDHAPFPIGSDVAVMVDMV